jgi:hypothetical protein
VSDSQLRSSEGYNELYLINKGDEELNENLVKRQVFMRIVVLELIRLVRKMDPKGAASIVPQR